jgi:hypothetical protein
MRVIRGVGTELGLGGRWRWESEESEEGREVIGGEGRNEMAVLGAMLR